MEESGGLEVFLYFITLIHLLFVAKMHTIRLVLPNCLYSLHLNLGQVFSSFAEHSPHVGQVDV